MGDIVLLDEQTINKIAAGEVVDRPASIVKELVENSIDAKATSISIEIRKGGVSYIKIIDNGTGFKSDDIDLAKKTIDEKRKKITTEEVQVDMFNYKMAEVTSMLEKINLDELTPKDALEVLYKLKEKLD